MKNALFSILIVLLVLPVFAPWIPHGVVHALHDSQAVHHGTENRNHAHKHDHVANDHNSKPQASNHHPINFNTITYFSDYLHVDLQNPDQITVEAPATDLQNIDFALVAAINPSPRYELASVQSRAPPDWRRHRPDNTPLYLSTQRLRI